MSDDIKIQILNYRVHYYALRLARQELREAHSRLRAAEICCEEAEEARECSSDALLVALNKSTERFDAGHPAAVVVPLGDF